MRCVIKKRLKRRFFITHYFPYSYLRRNLFVINFNKSNPNNSFKRKWKISKVTATTASQRIRNKAMVKNQVKNLFKRTTET